MEDLKISVVIPVYKVEKYLKQCVDSVLQQSYKNIEVILVNDGSPDNCPHICDAYAKQDERVVVIHKTNGGLSDARNAGIKKATGKYVAFLDSDDFWCDEQAIERLVERIRVTNADVINYSYKKYYEDSQKEILRFRDMASRPLDLITKEKQLDYLTKNHLYIACAWNKLIRLELFSNEMMFEENRLSEDVEWCTRLMLYAKSFDFVCESFYCYRQRRDSIVHTIGEKGCNDLQSNIIKCINIAQQAPEEIKEYIYRYTAYQYATFVAVQAIAEKCPPECIVVLSEYKWLLAYHGGNKKVLYLDIMCKILGFKQMCRLIRVTRTIWDKWRMKR